MTRKKAIERAWKCDCDEQGCTGKYLPKVAAERGYDEGRIAGLREAASSANEPSDREKYRQWANKLAKKARRK